MSDFFKLDRNIKLRILMTFIGVLTYFTIGSSMTIYYNQHLGAGITGILLIVSSVVSFLVGMWSGHFSDVQGRKPTMLIGMITSALGAALAAVANSPFLVNPWLTFLGLMLASFGFGFFNSGASAMLVDITTSESRKLVFSLNYWTLNLAAALGSGISGWLFRDHLFLLLLLCLLGDLLNLLIVVFLIRETFVPSEHLQTHENNIFKAYLRVSKDKTFVLYLVASLFVAMIFAQVDFFIPVHLTNDFRVSHLWGLEIYGQRMLAIMALLNSALVILFLSTVRRWTNHWSNKVGFVVGAALMGLGWVIAVSSHQFIWELLAALINVLGELILVPFEQALRADMMNPEQVGAYTGAFSAIGPIAQVISGLLVSASPFLKSGGMGIVLALVTVFAIVPAVLSINRFERGST